MDFRLLFCDDGLEKMDDAEAQQATREAHSTYRNFKDAEVRKAAAEDEKRAAGNELSRALKSYTVYPGGLLIILRVLGLKQIRITGCSIYVLHCFHSFFC